VIAIAREHEDEVGTEQNRLIPWKECVLTTQKQPIVLILVPSLSVRRQVDEKERMLSKLVLLEVRDAAVVRRIQKACPFFVQPQLF
jgi:hypothetical protein